MKTTNIYHKTTLIGLIALMSSPMRGDEPTLSGSVSFDLNSHFMSYGADVWGAGTEPDLLFEPSASLDFNFGNGFGVYTGIWFDINDQGVSPIGGDIQEVDVWIGAYYTIDKVTLDVAFQQWYYLSETEGILDITLSYDTFLSPYVKAHIRTEPVGSQSEGAVIQIGGSYDFSGNDVGIPGVDFSIPFSIGLFADENYQGGDDTLGYLSIGLGFSYPLTGIPEGFGSWDLHGNATLWHTPEDAVPGNPDETFVSFNLGVGIGF